ncbi:MAG: HNH endonuclease signature motif containing protein [Candidatus Saccharimonadaceae bacterium]
MDHIDGDSQNNTEINLRLICPNCHSLTESYRGANKGKGTRNITWAPIV